MQYGGKIIDEIGLIEYTTTRRGSINIRMKIDNKIDIILIIKYISNYISCNYLGAKTSIVIQKLNFDCNPYNCSEIVVAISL